MDNKKQNLTGIIVMVVVAMLILILAINSKAAPAKAATKPAAKASYSATIVGSAVIDPATVGAMVEVKNTGTAPGKPQCTVTAKSSNGSYSGFKIDTATQDLKPGETYNNYDKVTVTNQGAAYVTDVTIVCQ